MYIYMEFHVGTSVWNLVQNSEHNRFFCFFATARRPSQVLVSLTVESLSQFCLQNGERREVHLLQLRVRLRK